MRIRIAFLIDAVTSERAGTEKQLLGILERLDPRKFEPHLVCLCHTPWLESRKLPCPVTALGYRGFLKPNFPRVVGDLAALIDREEIDIVQTFFEDSVFVGLLARYFSRRHPRLLASRRDLGLGQDELWYHNLFRMLRPAANRRFDGVVVNAEAIRTHVAQAEGFPAERIRVIPNGIEPPRGAVRPAIFDAAPTDLRIVITANLKPVKRLDLFLTALAGLRDICPELDFRAYLLGEGRLLPQLVAMAGELGIDRRVHFLGARHDVVDFLTHADIGVLCSDREGLSNAVLEYMACGLPVVATAVGGNGEIVGEENGILVPPGDPMALAQALAQLAGAPERRRAMGEAGRERIARGYLWEKVMPQWESYYHSLLPSTTVQVA